MLLHPHEARGFGPMYLESSSRGSAPLHWGSNPLQPLLLLKEVNSRLYKKAVVNLGARAHFDDQPLAGRELSASTYRPSSRHCSGQLGQEHQVVKRTDKTQGIRAPGGLGCQCMALKHKQMPLLFMVTVTLCGGKQQWQKQEEQVRHGKAPFPLVWG